MQPSPDVLTPAQTAMLETFERHMAAELSGDLDATMATMTDEPNVNHVPVLTGGVGRDGVRAFYRDHLVGRFFPPDVEVKRVSRTVGTDRVLEELAITFTHTVPVNWMLPGLAPTGRRVEAAVVVVVGFEGERIAYERIYWDQASVLVQLGLLDPTGLPVSGAESSRKVLDPHLPSRRIADPVPPALTG
ncbi:MAG: nuclear transport factor 2 family protein [Gemmatimonadaceae bacterium]